MPYNYLTKEAINSFIKMALTEDAGDGDHTSLASIPKGITGRARLLLKDEGVLAGIDLAKRIFEYIDPQLEVSLLKNDGDLFKYGEIALTVSGSVHSILLAERLVLNNMQRMSGIASYTQKLQHMIAHTKAKVLDTRKTTPNYRMM